jgi:hypothetical protein
MATWLYKDFLIIATVEAKANGWRSIVDISGPDPTPTLSTIDLNRFRRGRS